MKKGAKHSPEALVKISAASKGRRHSEETKAKLRAIQTGRKCPAFSAEARHNMSVAHIGYKHSEKSKAKIGLFSKGKKASIETLAKMSIAQKGHAVSAEQRIKLSIAQKRRFSDPTKHPMWKGGISRGSYAWTFSKELKEKIRCWDDNRCQLCGISEIDYGQSLDVHHIDYNKKNSDPVNLISLCRSCHSRMGTNRKHWAAFFQAIMRDRKIS